MSDFPRGTLEVFEDFGGDNSAVLTETQGNNGSQDCGSKHGGWWVQTMTADEDSAALIATELAFEIDEGHPFIGEVRLYSSDVSVSSIFVGCTDDNAESGAVVIEDEDGTLNTVAKDAFGFLLEGEQDETWQIVGVQNDIDNTQEVLTKATDAADDVIQTLRIEANPNDSGTVKFFVDGKPVATKTGWFRSGIVYCFGVSCDGRAGVYTTNIDYIYASAPRS